MGEFLLGIALGVLVGAVVMNEVNHRQSRLDHIDKTRLTEYTGTEGYYCDYNED